MQDEGIQDEFQTPERQHEGQATHDGTFQQSDDPRLQEFQALFDSQQKELETMRKMMLTMMEHAAAQPQQDIPVAEAVTKTEPARAGPVHFYVGSPRQSEHTVLQKQPPLEPSAPERRPETTGPITGQVAPQSCQINPNQRLQVPRRPRKSHE